ncbi:Di-sulfide bridge nucleocytoplasmic transport domain-containing protein [Gautieria morchelliformis]|nr:Di-sulfide bridge nucleocytoplasmic transport domain-containing protein [Gautieria morchelliformis]
MNDRYERRSQEAPMDFEFTDKNRNVIPIDSPFRTPVKRSHTDMATPTPPFPQPNPSTPTFCSTSNVPFMFHQPAPSSTPSHPWVPSSGPRMLLPEVNDVDMQDVSPPKPETSTSEVRTVATGALSRVFRARQKQKERSRELVSRPQRRRGGGMRKSYSEPITTTSSHNHHYTLHMPARQLSHSEIPYMLLGYLQFFFNLSLVIGLLYLMFYFVRAVQKDVEQKMAEHMLESLQEIKECARLYADNFCAEKPSPIIMLQCQEWKACMDRDASIVGRTRLLAELIGEVINGFMEPITWRTMIFLTTALTMGIALINTLLMFYRARHAPINNSPPPPPNPMMYGALPPYWGQSPNPSFPYAFDRQDEGSEIRRPWSAPMDGEDSLETPSRRRRLHERDNFVKV